MQTLNLLQTAVWFPVKQEPIGSCCEMIFFLARVLMRERALTFIE